MRASASLMLVFVLSIPLFSHAAVTAKSPCVRGTLQQRSYKLSVFDFFNSGANVKKNVKRDSLEFVSKADMCSDEKVWMDQGRSAVKVSVCTLRKCKPGDEKTYGCKEGQTKPVVFLKTPSSGFMRISKCHSKDDILGAINTSVDSGNTAAIAALANRKPGTTANNKRATITTRTTGGSSIVVSGPTGGTQHQQQAYPYSAYSRYAGGTGWNTYGGGYGYYGGSFSPPPPMMPISAPNYGGTAPIQPQPAAIQTQTGSAQSSPSLLAPVSNLISAATNMVTRNTEAPPEPVPVVANIIAEPDTVAPGEFVRVSWASVGVSPGARCAVSMTVNDTKARLADLNEDARRVEIPQRATEPVVFSIECPGAQGDSASDEAFVQVQ